MQGEIVEEFDTKTKKGEKLHIAFRFPKRRDVGPVMRFINKARDEAKFLGSWRHETMKSERRFINAQIENLEKGKGLFLLVEAEGEIVGNAIINPKELDSQAHVAHFGIVLRERFTGIEIGTRLMRRMLELAKQRTEFKIIESSYFSKNTRSAKLHKKFGFRQHGSLPKGEMRKDGSYGNRVLVYKAIKKL